jgi:lysine 2,3-aminomutase
MNLHFQAPGFGPAEDGLSPVEFPPGKSSKSPGHKPTNLLLDDLLRMGKLEMIELLWEIEPKMHRLLTESETIQQARNNLFNYLNELERTYFNIYADHRLSELHDLEKNQAKWCVRVFKNIIRSENEKLAHRSSLGLLWKIAHRQPRALSEVGEGFVMEMIFLSLGINGKFAVDRHETIPDLPTDTEQDAGVNRSMFLDRYAEQIHSYVSHYHCGLDEDVVRIHQEQRRKIMRHFGVGEAEWNDYQWQLNHIITHKDQIEQLVELTDSEREGLDLARRHNIPVQITPYYLSLFHPEAETALDRAVRAQVLPSPQYVMSVVEAQASGKTMDFMGEASTSPIQGVTRRYVQILILKPFDSCPQICVYCQRNWEIKELDDCRVNRADLENALDWIERNDSIEEVLVTGGDPLTLPDETLRWILDRVAAMPHVQRIRIGTRTPVTMPSRITDELVEMLKSYQEWGRREICIITHFETGLEMTPEALEALSKVRNAGISIYNQQVFTYYNSRKFETFYLRKLLKRCGVDPYYTFNTKGKEETRDYRVPIARLLQEWAEEARLAPGLARTDTPVFNVPTLGKSYLQSWQDHEIVQILPDGSRVYRFYPWEKMLALASPYLFTDTPISDYLRRLQSDGEDVNDYNTIWSYF